MLEQLRRLAELTCLDAPVGFEEPVLVPGVAAALKPLKCRSDR
ncbi:MAG: hypothetical protein U0992_06750 [Planctomycetaceae bacterium]